MLVLSSPSGAWAGAGKAPYISRARNDMNKLCEGLPRVNEPVRAGMVGTARRPSALVVMVLFAIVRPAQGSVLNVRRLPGAAQRLSVSPSTD